MKGDTTMNNFLKVAYSTEVFSEKAICYDTTSYDYSVIYEYKESYTEFHCECRFEDEGWN